MKSQKVSNQYIHAFWSNRHGGIGLSFDLNLDSIMLADQKGASLLDKGGGKNYPEEGGSLVLRGGGEGVQSSSRIFR